MVPKRKKPLSAGAHASHPSRPYRLRILMIVGANARCERVKGEPRDPAWFPLSELSASEDQPISKARL